MKNDCLLCGRNWLDVGQGHGLYVTYDRRLDGRPNFCHISPDVLEANGFDWLHDTWYPMCRERSKVPLSDWFTIRDPLTVLYVANWIPLECSESSPLVGLDTYISWLDPPKSFVMGHVVTDVPWSQLWRPTDVVAKTKPRLRLRYYRV